MLTFAMHSIIFYKTSSGQCPVKEFLTNLPDKERQKVTLGADARQGCLDGAEGVFQVIPEHRRNPGGTLLTRRQCHQAVRVHDEGNLVVLTNGFSKKSQKTPAQEIALAEQRKKDYEKRQEH